MDNRGVTSAIDLLLTIRDINANGLRRLTVGESAEPPPFFDVSGDDIVNPLDIVQEVRELNRLAIDPNPGPRTVVVPEPSAIAMLLCGLAIALAVSRTRKNPADLHRRGRATMAD